MTWTSAFGKGSGWLLQKIVNGLALSKISPNTLTFIGLLINILAAFFFGYARPENNVRMFVYAGLVIIGAGLFDMVDGRVARQTNQVSVFGAFFDSVLDRYSDVALFFGLLVFYARGNRFFYVVLAAFCMTASVMVSYTRARAPKRLSGPARSASWSGPSASSSSSSAHSSTAGEPWLPRSGCWPSCRRSQSSTAFAIRIWKLNVARLLGRRR